MSSILDVAQRAGVSIATVSNVVHGTKPVSQELLSRVNQAIRELNYQPNYYASSLKKKRTQKIGVIITDLNRIFFSQVLKGIHEFCLSQQYSVIFSDTNDLLDTEQSLVRMLVGEWVDGIIVDSVAQNDDTGYFTYLAELSGGAKRVPVVSLERNFEPYKIDSVLVDNYYGGCLAINHLAECGCRKLVHITGPQNSCMVQLRLSACLDTAKENRITVAVADGDFSPRSGYHSMKKVIESGSDFDGVFAANDQMAVGAIYALEESGCRIPDDVKVVGFDNTFVASIISPALTTIDVPKHQMGVAAAQQLINRIEKIDSPVSVTELPVKLVVRQSTQSQAQTPWELFGW